MGPSCQALVPSGCGGAWFSASFDIFYVRLVLWGGLVAALVCWSVPVSPVFPTFCLLAGHSRDRAPWGPAQLMHLGGVASGWLPVEWVLLAHLSQLVPLHALEFSLWFKDEHHLQYAMGLRSTYGLIVHIT